MYQGDLIRLRAFENGDLLWALAYNNDYQIMRGAMSGMLLPSNDNDEAQFMAQQSSYSRDKYQFAIETLAEKHFLGQCGFTQVDWKNRVAELGIIIGNQKDQGKGYGADAVKTLCRFGFQEMNLHKIKASVFDFNQAALKCYEKCGFQREGCLKQELYREGAYHDVILLALFS